MLILPAALATLVVLAAFPASAQLPSPRRLSAEDKREFNQELRRLKTVLATANDKCAVQLQIANTYAVGGQYREAIRGLRTLVDADFGLDPSRDPDFANLRNTREFQWIIKKVRRQTPAVLNSRLIATIDDRHLAPESLVFDPTRKMFILGSTARDEIVECSGNAPCVPLSTSSHTEQGYALGLKADHISGKLWATANTPTGASLRRYDIETGKLEQAARIEGKHVFNDLALSSGGMVYVTDTAEGSVYQLDPRNNALRRIAPQRTFTGANGIAISRDDKMLYVSAWGDGIDVIDLRFESVLPIVHPNDVCLAFVDGLYATEGSLIAIQNGPILPRIVQFRLDRAGRNIVQMSTLERRNPSFDGVTTGALVDDYLYYVANPQIDNKGNVLLDPLKIFAVRVIP